MAKIRHANATDGIEGHSHPSIRSKGHAHVTPPIPTGAGGGGQSRSEMVVCMHMRKVV